ncbi:hypothetical protein [Fodinicola acaciae]|uniref:hypothetical protein n=1 Tax=Fodinicola acaciae TaxID=2681555 RepID=UPI0013D8C08E|nr:hypothetical protein [Fodinicola acaciae]
MAGKRAVHHVGSMPLDMRTADEAMRLILDVAGPHLRSLPDGEPGRNYVQPVVDGFARHPAFQQTGTGDWSTLDKRTTYKVRRGHRIDEKPLDDFLLYLASGVDSWPVFQRLREEYVRPELSYQVGLPTDFVIAFIAFGPGRAFAQRKAFLDASLRGIQRIHELAGDQVIFQLEAPAETLLTAKAGPLRPVAARYMAKGMANIARNSPVGTRFGIHLCLGSLEDVPQGTVHHVGQYVPVLNIAREIWPADRPLEYVHAPMFSPRGLDYLRGLEKLEVGPEVRVAAGIVREERPYEEQVALLTRAEDALGHAVDVSAVCGLGRRTNAAAAKAALQRAVALATC